VQVSFKRAEPLNFLTKITHRKAKEADPASWPSKIHYEYSPNTSNTSLRPHIQKHHLDLFLRLAKEKGWTIQLPGLVSQSRSQAANEAAASQVRQPEKFDEKTFHQHLVNFIIADDQVHICSSLFHFHYAHISLFLVPECC
jgi:hypothetical protein